MDQEQIVDLKKRNARIIDAVLQKAQVVCPGSIALIGIGGSFCHGDIHERSDLDLCIVINNNEGWKIADCFILDKVGFDIYCTPWHRLEAMAEYTNPHVTKLLHLDIVYHADEESLARYMSLRKTVQDKLEAPFSVEDAKNVTMHLTDAMHAYASVMLGDSAAECKYASAKMLLAVEYLIYHANKAYIHYGVRRTPEELHGMDRLPQNFWMDYQNLITANSLDGIQACSTRLMKSVQDFVAKMTGPVLVKKEITQDAIRGTFEEIVSNWRSKMVLAAQTDDAYLSLMTMASCQGFYDEFSTEYNVERVRLFEEFHIDDLSRSAERFDAGADYYRRLYAQLGEPIRSYASIEEFEKAYL